MYSKTAQFYDILYSFKDSRGVVLVEPWLTLDTFRTGMPHLEIVQQMAEQGEDYQARASILDLLRSGNDPKNLLQMHRPYFKIARIGLGNEYPGANWVQHWYGRNLKIFVNLTRIVDSEDERILLIIGSGHAWLLRQFAQEDGFFKLEEPIDYL